MTTMMTPARVRLLMVATLCCLPALAGAQQFRVERDFDVLRAPNGVPLQNNYFVSLLLNPVVPDSGNKSASPPQYRSKCVGDPLGPPAGDGVIDSLDLLCAWFTARSSPATAGSFTVIRWLPEECTPVSQSAFFTYGGALAAWPPTPFAFDPNIGYRVIVGVPVGATYSPRNHVVLEGDGEPQWAGVDVFASTTCGPLATRGTMLNFPYDAAYTEAAEIACGLRGVDWFDANADGRPDTCWDDADGDGRYDAGEAPTGIYDGLHALLVNRMLNTVAAQGHDPFIVAPGFRGRVNVAGNNYPLAAGEAYWVQLSQGHVTTRWDPPLR
jgi:hypothetical protein